MKNNTTSGFMRISDFTYNAFQGKKLQSNVSTDILLLVSY